ncbi:hypothetical protein SDC9_91377 [bioreactor metagenome]|uniref:Uncharacterized protein n=1 Tax=bioreactor metagenome TaxID=1076179 RepID=A0A644ZVG5_9ZZZZ
MDAVVEVLHRLPHRPARQERPGGVRGHLGQHVHPRRGQGQVDGAPPVGDVAATVGAALLPRHGECLRRHGLLGHGEVGGPDDHQVGVRLGHLVPGAGVAVHVDVRGQIGRRRGDPQAVVEHVLAAVLARCQVTESVAGGDPALVAVGRLVSDPVGPHMPPPPGPAGCSAATHSGRGSGPRRR